jgi:hypothetical protein
MRLLRPGIRGLRAGRGELRPIDELERSLDRLRLDGDASRRLLDGVLASEDVIGAFADAQAFARAFASLPRRRPAVVARPMPRLAFATVVMASTMTVGTAFAQDLPAIAQLAVARVVALIQGPVPLEAAAEAPVPSISWRETPATNRQAPEPVSLPTPAATEIEPEPEPPAPSPEPEPTPVAEAPEADVEPPPAEPKRAAEERVPVGDPVVPVPDRAGPPQLPDGGVFEELGPIVEPAPVVESTPTLPDASAEPEPPSLPEAAAEPPVVVEEPEEPADEEPVKEEEPPAEEPVDEEPVDEDGKGKKDKKKEKEDHADEHAHEHADEHAAIHD